MVHTPGVVTFMFVFDFIEGAFLSIVFQPISIELMWNRDHVDTDSAGKVGVENETQSVLSEEEKILEEIRSCRLTSEGLHIVL